jgi:hypothetical protein
LRGWNLKQQLKFSLALFNESTESTERQQNLDILNAEGDTALVYIQFFSSTPPLIHSQAIQHIPMPENIPKPCPE